MYKNILFFSVIFLAVLLQISFFPNLIPIRVFPDVALIIILFWTVRRGFEETWKWAIFAGLMVDLAYFWPVGTSVFSFVLIAYLVNSLAKRFLVTQTVFRFLILLAFVVLGTIFNSILLILAVKLARREAADLNMLFFNSDIIFKILYNFGIFSFIYAPLGKLEKFSISLDSRLKSFR
ncbi:MAG: rod shape-determining protein MreD [Candidatus Moranbacteria bacterium RBG_19FT_COMBO_42_6]|nr:MAG: rod shape-determining protein MreD [Candidatus Moranbacteria bacterium RBG_19FT_COMBO_42_6]